MTFDEDNPHRHKVHAAVLETNDRKTRDLVVALYTFLNVEVKAFPSLDRPAFFRTCRHAVG